jgi:hypothetical protein
LFNGFQKKSQKTPSEEIDKAVKIMNEYFDENGIGTKLCSIVSFIEKIVGSKNTRCRRLE